ncbi:MAG: DUF4838 domain-containing protein [Clostridia bacterium]|nr:DUF4838 domain-containing protein [Clostridia bacterium]
MKIKRIATALLATLFAFSMVSCSGDNKNSGSSGNKKPGQATASGTIGDISQHYYTGGIHKFNMTQTNTVFAENNKTEYKIVLSENATGSDRSGASFITRFTKEAMGANIETVTESEVTYTKDSKFIVFNCPTMFEAAGLTMTQEDIKENGYYIKSAGNSVFVMTKDQVMGYGARNAGLEILRQLIGLEFFTGDSYSYNCVPGDKIMMPGFDIVEAPDITWIHYTNNASTATQMGLRGTNNADLFMNVQGGHAWHNTLSWLPTNEATKEQQDHWYNAAKTELCYTAHGNQEMLDEMIRRCVEKAIASVEATPDKKVLTLTLMDGGHRCDCKACTDSANAYGGTESAAYIKFVNRVADGLDAYLTAKAEESGTEKREVILLFFAYNNMTNPPVKEENGKLVPYDDSVRCRDNVGVYYAPIGVQFNESLYMDVNSAFNRAIQGWNVLSDHIFVWYYNANFFEYLYPFNTFSALPECYRAFASNDVEFIYNQGQYNQGQDGSTGFGIFREYLHHQLRWNANQSCADLTNRFFKGYFKEAEEPMRRYFDELTAHFEYLEDTYPTQVNGSIYHHPTDIKFWPLALLNQWLGYIDEAYKTIEPLKLTDPVKYNTLRSNIVKESIFLRYAKLTIHEGSFSANELAAERIAFKNDCNASNITRTYEGGLLSSLFESWGI